MKELYDAIDTEECVILYYKDEEDYDKQLKIREGVTKKRGKKKLSSKEKQKRLEEYRTNYYQKNKEKILAAAKERHKKNKDVYNERRNKYRKEHVEETRMMWLLDYWRRKQRDLALEWLLQHKGY